MSSVRFGVQYSGVSMAPVIGPMEFAEQAEAWGYEAFFVPDLETFPALDPMTVLSAVAQRSQRMLLGTGVLALPFRNPYQLAKIAVSVDALSNERLVLGLGTGMFPGDFHVEQVDKRLRGRITDELLEVLRRYLDGEAVTHQGQFYKVEDASLSPRPTRHIPIWLGATWADGYSEAALRRTARFGDGFHAYDVPVEAYADAIDRIGELAAGYGRDATQFEWSCNMWLCIGQTKNRALTAVNSDLKRRFGEDAWKVDPRACCAIGTPADCIEAIESYADVGVTTFVMNVLSEPGDILTNFETFANDVLPHFKDRSSR